MLFARRAHPRASLRSRLYLVQVLLGLIALVGGAELLVRGGASLALQLRVPALVVGLTVVAFGTSTPELAVSLTAAIAQSTEMALANVNGSNIANILLVLGLAALVRPLEVRRGLLRREIPAATLLVMLVPLFLLDHSIARWEGGILLAVGILYNVMLVIDVRRGRAEAHADDLPEPTVWVKDVALIVGALITLAFGADLLVSGASELATRLGFSDRFIGLTVIALGTSAPEAATGVVGSYRGISDIAVGNSLGSNILNVAMVLGITALVYPIDLGDTAAWWDMAAVLAVTLLLVPVALRRRLGRVEGVLMLATYVGYLVMAKT